MCANLSPGLQYTVRFRSNCALKKAIQIMLLCNNKSSYTNSRPCQHWRTNILRIHQLLHVFLYKDLWFLLIVICGRHMLTGNLCVLCIAWQWRNHAQFMILHTILITVIGEGWSEVWLKAAGQQRWWCVVGWVVGGQPGVALQLTGPGCTPRGKTKNALWSW